MIYDIIPVSKPRMTQRDKRLPKRPCVAKYHAFKDECRLKKVDLPPCGAHVIYTIPMPTSWNKAKKARMDGTPHLVVPDRGNLTKALEDALYTSDSMIWDIHTTKYWGYEGSIEIIRGPVPEIKEYESQ